METLDGMDKLIGVGRNRFSEAGEQQTIVSIVTCKYGREYFPKGTHQAGIYPARQAIQ